MQPMRFFQIIALMAAVLSGCNKQKPGPEPGKQDQDYPPGVSLNEPLLKGEVKAGKVDGINIKGSGFNPDEDFIYVGWEEGGVVKYERVQGGSLEMKATRISFGIHVSSSFIEKKVKIYLDRPGYAKMPLTEELTIGLPKVEEGYIPDVALRSLLSGTRNPKIAELFNACGLLDVQQAALVAHGGSQEEGGQYALDIAGCDMESIEGIELFSGLKGVVAAWDSKKIKEIDLSKWTAKVNFYADRNSLLEKIVPGPYMRRVILHNCPNLKEVDAHHALWLHQLSITPGETSLKKADLRRLMSGTYSGEPSSEDNYIIWGGDSYFPMEDNAEIKIDAWFLFDHNTEDNGTPSCWSNIYDAWKRGAKIGVYSCMDMSKDVLATVPMYSVDPDALSPNNKLGPYKPSNKFRVDDPLTPENEAPVPYTP